LNWGDTVFVVADKNWAAKYCPCTLAPEQDEHTFKPHKSKLSSLKSQSFMSPPPTSTSPSPLNSANNTPSSTIDSLTQGKAINNNNDEDDDDDDDKDEIKETNEVDEEAMNKVRRLFGKPLKPSATASTASTKQQRNIQKSTPVPPPTPPSNALNQINQSASMRVVESSKPQPQSSSSSNFQPHKKPPSISSKLFGASMAQDLSIDTTDTDTAMTEGVQLVGHYQSPLSLQSMTPPSSKLAQRLSNVSSSSSTPMMVYSNTHHVPTTPPRGPSFDVNSSVETFEDVRDNSQGGENQPPPPPPSPGTWIDSDP